MTEIEKAIRIALDAHSGQTDKAGKPYILHPIRVMLACSGHEKLMTAAILHDVVEDTEITLQDLRDHDIHYHVVEAVDSLTRREGESYQSFIERCSSNDLARWVKLHDLNDNLKIDRLESISDADAERIQKYHHAKRFLEKLEWPTTTQPQE